MSAAEQPSDKLCAACGRPFSWRKKWARNWAEVRYCSDACRRKRAGDGASGRKLEASILDLLANRAPGASICPSEVARREFTGDAWREGMEPVRRAARRLAAEGRVEITQADRVVDPGSIRGPIRIRLRKGSGEPNRV